jgi:hypothetical protein
MAADGTADDGPARADDEPGAPVLLHGKPALSRR